MDAIRRSPNFAESQIRVLLCDLANSSHSVQMKAVKRFQEYISTYRPEVYDDDVDILFLGPLEGPRRNEGLLHYSGLNSEKHEGQLKRIAGPAISLLRFLVTLQDVDGDGSAALNTFYERFIILPIDQLEKVNFPKHIMGGMEGSRLLKAKAIAGQSRTGSSDDALAILSILLREHRTVDGELDPIDIRALLRNDKECEDKLQDWLRHVVTAERVMSLQHDLKIHHPTIGNLGGASSALAIRPTKWSSVVFKTVPVQEGEDAEIETTVSVDEPSPIPDPLGLIVPLDLREAQELFAAGGLTAPRRTRHVRFDDEPVASSDLMFDDDTEDEDDDEDINANKTPFLSSENKLSSEDDATSPRPLTIMRSTSTGTVGDDAFGGLLSPFKAPRKKKTRSILPVDKNFSPPLFLSILHGNASYNDLQAGLNHLQQILRRQGTQRSDHVRQHLGLFVNCVEALDWLKAYRLGTHSDLDYDIISIPGSTRRPSISPVVGRPSDPFNARGGGFSADRVSSTTKYELCAGKFLKAKSRLDLAKGEAQRILAPILGRMERDRKIRTADQVLRLVCAALEHPHNMRTAMEKGTFEDAVVAYRKAKALSAVTYGAKVVSHVHMMVDSYCEELCASCENILSDSKPQNQFSDLLRAASALRELKGDDAYRTGLLTAFTVHLEVFVEALKGLRRQMVDDAAQQIRRGHDIFMSRDTTNHPISGPVEHALESLKQQAAARSRRAHTNSLSLPPITSLPRDRVGDDVDVITVPEVTDATRLTPKDFGMDDEEESQSWGGEFGLFSMPGMSTKGSNGTVNPVFSVNETEEEIMDELCGKARLLHVYRLVDLVFTRVPCMHSLVMALNGVIQPSFSAPPSSADTRSGSSAVSNASGIYIPRGEVGHLSRELGAWLSRCCLMLREVILGSSTTSRHLPSSYLEASVSVHTALDDDDDEATRNVLSLPFFTDALREPFMSQAMQETAELFEELEIILKLDKKSPGGDADRPLSMKALRFPNKNMDILAVPDITGAGPSSSIFIPFTDALTILQELSKEGEITAAQKLIAKIHCECLQILSEHDSHKHNSPPSSSSSQAQRRHTKHDTNYSNGEESLHSRDWELTQSPSSVQSIESAVSRTQLLLLRGLFTLRKRTRRPHWISDTVINGIKTVLSAFANTLRDDAMTHYSADHGAVESVERTEYPRMSPSTSHAGSSRSYASRSLQTASSSSGDNQFVHVSSIDLLALENSLKSTETSHRSAHSLGASRIAGKNPNSQTANSSKTQATNNSHSSSQNSAALLAVLRACVALRTQAIPKIWEITLQHFPSSTSSSSTKSEGIHVSHSGRSYEHTDAGSQNEASTAALRESIVRAMPRAEPFIRRLFVAIANVSNNLVGQTAVLVIASAQEAALAEATAAAAYIETRLQVLRNVLHSGYQLLAHKEAGGHWYNDQMLGNSQKQKQNSAPAIPVPGHHPNGNTFPSHLAHLLLTVGQDKNALRCPLRSITIEYGERVKRRGPRHDSRDISFKEEEDYDEDDDDDSSIENDTGGVNYDENLDQWQGSLGEARRGNGATVQGVIQKGLLSATKEVYSGKDNNSESYQDFLFKEVCIGLIELYQDLLSMLTAADSSEQKGFASMKLTLCAAQAAEEMEFIKVIMQPVLPAHPILLSSVAARSTGADLANRNTIATLSQLMSADCRVLSALIQPSCRNV